jgi:hypothetical protein
MSRTPLHHLWDEIIFLEVAFTAHTDSQVSYQQQASFLSAAG